jgi:hypothetical protein
VTISPARRTAVCEWLRSNNINPDDVPDDTTIIEDSTNGVIRYKAFLQVDGLPLDEAAHEASPSGRVVLDSYDVATEWRETPLLQPAPDEFPA